MKFTNALWSLIFVSVLTACGGSGKSPNIGVFPAITKAEGDASFSLTPPSSDSGGGFTYSSSNLTVATIAGSTVSVLMAGTTTITATQASAGNFDGNSVTAVLTVAPRTCTSPAIYQNHACVAPVPVGNIVVKSGRTWLPVGFIADWVTAQAYCTTSTINGLAGWRLPNEFELLDLYASGMMNGQGWSLGKTWSSVGSDVFTTVGVVASTHLAVSLTTGVSTGEVNGNGAYVACLQ